MTRGGYRREVMLPPGGSDYHCIGKGQAMLEMKYAKNMIRAILSWKTGVARVWTSALLVAWGLSIGMMPAFADPVIYSRVVSGDPAIPGGEFVVEVALRDNPTTKVANYVIDLDYDSDSVEIIAAAAQSGGFPMTPSVLPMLTQPPLDPGPGAHRQFDAVDFAGTVNFLQGALFRVTFRVGDTPTFPLSIRVRTNRRDLTPLLSQNAKPIHVSFDSSLTWYLGAGPSPTPTVEPTPEPTPSPTELPTLTPTPTISPTASPSPTPEQTPPPTETSTPSPSPTEDPSLTPTMTPTYPPTPSESPTYTPTFHATFTPTPTPTATVSPTPTLTPSPTPSPEPTPIHFDFSLGLNGWHWGGAPESYDLPTTGLSLIEPRGLILQARNNTGTFGYWESPVVRLADEILPDAYSGSGFRLGGLATEATLLRADWSVRGLQADSTTLPQMRLRLTRGDFQRSALFVVESKGDAFLSPTSQGSVYRHWIAPGAGELSFRLAVDLLNFDAGDNPDGGFVIESVSLGREESVCFDESARPEADWRFADDCSSWTAVLAAGNCSLRLNAAHAAWLPDGLALSPAGQKIVAYGYWTCSPADAPRLEAGRLYRAVFTVESSLPASRRAEVPQFRLRANVDTHEAAWMLVVSSKGDGASSPIAGHPMHYALFLEWPEEMPSRTLLLSFDLLHDDPADDARSTVILRRVRVESVPVAP